MATRTADFDRPGLSLHGRLVPLGAGLLLAALATDLLYWRTVMVEWETFSVWLIAGGLMLAALSGVALIVDLIAGRGRRLSWLRFLLFTAVVVLAVFNVFVHSRDGYTAVVPTGLALSAVTAVLLLIAAALGWETTVPAARQER